MKFRTALLWLLLGMFLTGLPVLVALGKSQYHYLEVGTFFKGDLGSRQVVGTAFTEAQGSGFMAGTKWKVQIVNADRTRTTIYEKSSVFQENVPHQPEIEIKDDRIRIDDGEETIMSTVRRSASPVP